MISKHKDLAIVFVRAISMLIIVIYHYSCSLVQDHITNKHLPLYGYASGRWGQSAVYTFLIISGYVLFMNYAPHFSFVSILLQTSQSSLHSSLMYLE